MADLDSIDRSYLLGELSTDDTRRFELAVMEDAAAGDRLLAAEDDLIDDYLEGALNPVERQRFEAVFMAAPLRAEKVRFAKELSAHAAARRASAAPRSTKTRAAWAGLSVAASLLLAVGLWRAQSPPGFALPTAPQPGASSPKAPARRTVSFVLATTATRSGAVPSVAIPPGTDDLVIQIDLSNEDAPLGFEAAIRATADNRDVWKNADASPLRSPDGTLSITVPASSGIATPGSYELSLSARGSSGRARLIAILPFRVR